MWDCHTTPPQRVDLALDRRFRNWWLRLSRAAVIVRFTKRQPPLVRRSNERRRGYRQFQGNIPSARCQINPVFALVSSQKSPVP